MVHGAWYLGTYTWYKYQKPFTINPHPPKLDPVKIIYTYGQVWYIELHAKQNGGPTPKRIIGTAIKKVRPSRKKVYSFC